MSKIKIRLLTSLAIIAVGIGSYFIYQNVYENKNDKNKKIVFLSLKKIIRRMKFHKILQNMKI